MKKTILILMTVLFLATGCTKQEKETVQEAPAPVEETIEENHPEETVKEEEQTETKEYTFDICKSIVVECFNHYYQWQMDAQLEEESKSFYVWSPVVLENGPYTDGVHFIQYKANPEEVIHNKDVIWKDGNPVGNKTVFKRGYPELLEVMKGPIRIRKDHSTDSEQLALAKNGDQYLCFDQYDDGKYIWYKVYFKNSDSYGWMASDKNDPWIGFLA